jgi:phytoene synthase
MAPNPQSPTPELDALVRRVDEDRWLASRFAPPDARARLIALYAANYEIARTAEVVREPALGEIRLQWWRDALEEAANRAPPREHPALQEIVRRFPEAAPQLRAIAQARRADLEPAPFQTWADIERYLDATAGALMRLAVEACAPEANAAARPFVAAAAQAWGLVGLVRASSFWQARGRTILPREDGTPGAMLARAEAACAAVRAMPAPPSATFPALGYAALLPGYLRALRRQRREPALIVRQLRLIAAAATGRF